MKHIISKHKFLFLVTIAVFLLAGYRQGTSASIRQDGPMIQMKEAVDQILVIMRGEQFSQPETRADEKKRIVAILQQHFDFEEMSMRTLARYWKERTPEEKQYFMKLFTRLLENTYVDRVDTYSGELLVFTGEKIKGRYAEVYSNFVKNNLEVPVYYRLKNDNGSWKVYDVIIEGVSLIRNYRTQFQSILDRENYQELVKKMEEKVAKLKETQ